MTYQLGFKDMKYPTCQVENSIRFGQNPIQLGIKFLEMFMKTLFSGYCFDQEKIPPYNFCTHSNFIKVGYSIFF
jgi:hypothetical protein